MRKITYKDWQGKTCTWKVLPHLSAAWDIFLEANNIKKIPNHGQFCEFLTLLIKTRYRSPDKF